jgi:hypothetical protein
MKRHFLSILSAAVASSAIGLSAPAFAQSDADKAAARSLATQGAEAFQAGRNDEAIDLLSRAEALFHAPTHLLLIARAQAARGKLVLAKEAYLKIVREELAATAPEPFKRAHADAQKELAALEPRIASLRIDLKGGAGATVTMDGEAVPAALVGVYRPVDPGERRLAATPPGGTAVEVTVKLGESEKKEATLDLTASTPAAAAPPAPVPAPEPPKDEPATGGGMSPLRIAGFAGVGLGVAGGVVGTLFLLKGGGTQGDSDDLFTTNRCDVRCSAATQSEIETLDADAANQKTIGVIGLAAGGALIAGGVVLILVGGKSSPAPQTGHVHVEPWLAPGGGGLRGTF